MAGRRVLITGAGSGLGLALAKRYAAAGDRVAVVDIVAARAEAAVATLAGGGHLAVVADVGSDASMQALADRVSAEWGGLDVLINNAGVASGGKLVDAPIDEWRWVLEINLLGVVRGCRLFVPGMLAAGRGQVINIASFAGLAGAPGIMSYGVAKAAVVALSEQLRAEVHGRGVRVAVACPSFFRTNLTENFRGSPKMLSVANRLMDTARQSADDIAARVHRDAEAGIFLILPTRAEVLRWRLKRWFPEYYFRKLCDANVGALRTEAE